MSWTHICFSRYLIEYSVSDSSGVAATPLAISITFVEVAVVTGSFLFIGQADNATEAAQHATQLCTSGTAPNSALTTDIAAVFQTWLASNVTTYVEQMTATLGTSTAVVAAVNTLELSLFSSVLTADVTVLNATIDQNVTSSINVNSSATTQTYAYNVTLEVVVLTADMLLSVFVDVLNSTTSRRRLMSVLDGSSAVVDSSMLLMPSCIPAIDRAADSRNLPGNVLVEPCQTAPQSEHLPINLLVNAAQPDQGPGGSMAVSMPKGPSCSTALQASHTGGCHMHQAACAVPLRAQSDATPCVGGTALVDSMPHPQQVLLHSKAGARSLQSTTSASAFPLASLLTFKVDLMLAAFGGTSGCSTTSMAALFYDDADVPDSLDDLCGTDGDTEDFSMNEALLASVNSTVPLLQVRLAIM